MSGILRRKEEEERPVPPLAPPSSPSILAEGESDEDIRRIFRQVEKDHPQPRSSYQWGRPMTEDEAVRRYRNNKRR